ncbi:flavin reductase family protein [Rhodococcus sp. NPDC055024]
MPEKTDTPSALTHFDPNAMSAGAFYRVLAASVVPRPIAWVSTRSAAGALNVAPYSFFTIASTNPPILQFNSVGHKDTWHNVDETSEFVVNIGTDVLIEQINATSIEEGRDFDEFVHAGLTPEYGGVLSVPRVREAPIAFECVKEMIIDVGNCSLIFGRVVRVSIRDDILGDDGLPIFDRLAAPSRLGGSEWGMAPSTVVHRRP